MRTLTTEGTHLGAPEGRVAVISEGRPALFPGQEAGRPALGLSEGEGAHAKVAVEHQIDVVVALRAVERGGEVA